MKKIISVLIICLFTNIVLKAQDTNVSFQFDTYIQKIDTDDVKDNSSHELGDIIARKLHIIEKTFILRYETKVGFNNSEIEVQKPDLLESVEKLDKYYRKAVKKNVIDKSEAMTEFSNCLDIAYTIFYEESDDFEKALSKTKNAEDIKAIYQNTRFLDNKITAIK